MQRLIRWGVMLAVVGAAGGPAPVRAGDAPLQIGMVQGMFRDVQPAMVQALSRPLRDLIRSKTGLTGDVAVVSDAHTLAARMQAKQFNLGVFHGFEFAWVRKDHPDLVPLVVTVPAARKLQAVVVVHQDNPAQALADLKDGAVVVPRGTKAHCFAFLDRERAGLPATCACPRTTPPVTPGEALDAVVNGEAAAALVEVSALDGYKAVQPGAFNNVRVLCRSDLFPPTVIAYRKGAVPDEAVEKIRALLTEAHTMPAGKPLMMLWNLRGFQDVPADYDAHLDKTLQVYPAPVVPAGKMGE